MWSPLVPDLALAIRACHTVTPLCSSAAAQISVEGMAALGSGLKPILHHKLFPHRTWSIAGGYAQRIFVKQVTKVLEDLLAALKTQEQS